MTESELTVLRGFLSSLASEVYVQEDFTEAIPVLREIVLDARKMCDRLGIAYEAGEDGGDEPA